MENVIGMGQTAAAALPDLSGELSEAELEFVVGGLTRAWSLTPELAVPATPLSHAAEPALKPPTL
ncbi:MAG TPA: hypothetical protein VFE68_16535 [Vicinamibacteria bacterium]|jgi:hypothetical protein|nr:hypothetical protein [Vicinamibacteria bacterium]